MTTRKYSIFILFYFIIYTSCIERVSRWPKELRSIDDVIEVFQREIDINGEIYIHDTVNLIKPTYIQIFDQFLFVADIMTTHVYSVYDMDKDNFVAKFINKGRGPYEYIGGRLEKFKSDSILVYNSLNHKVDIFSYNNIISANNNKPDKSILLLHSFNGDQALRIFNIDDYLFTSGYYKSDRFHLFNLNGLKTSSLGSYPSINYSGEYDNYHLGYKYGYADHTTNREIKKIAYCTKYSLEIFKYNLDKSIDIQKVFNIQWHIPEIYSATYQNGKPSVITVGKGAIVGAGDITSTKLYILMPISTYELIDTDRKGINDWFEYILIFDWEGNPIARLKLDKPIKYPLQIDKNEKYLYSIHTDGETGYRQIIRYDISFLKELKNEK